MKRSWRIYVYEHDLMPEVFGDLEPWAYEVFDGDHRKCRVAGFPNYDSALENAQKVIDVYDKGDLELDLISRLPGGKNYRFYDDLDTVKEQRDKLAEALRFVGIQWDQATRTWYCLWCGVGTTEERPKHFIHKEHCLYKNALKGINA